MYRNFTVCPHCTAKGLPGSLWKFTEQTPDVTLSDGKRFHLILVHGPDAIVSATGGVVAGRLAAQFSYVLDRLGDSGHRTAVLLSRYGDTRESVVKQAEKAATALAELLEKGEALAAEYEFDGDRLQVYRKQLAASE